MEKMNLVEQSPFRIERLGIVMRPDPSREDEVGGVLNPGAARGPDGELYLFPVWSEKITTHALELHECSSTALGIRLALSALDTLLSRKSRTNYVQQREPGAAKTRA